MEELDWKQRLKAGDKVILNTIHNHKSIVTVHRITKTQIVIKRKYPSGGEWEQRFKLSNGNAIGDNTYSSTWLSEGLPDNIREICEDNKRRSLIYKLKNTDYSKLSLETLIELNDVLTDGIWLESPKD